MTDETQLQKPPIRKRRWLKRVGIGFLALFVLLALFHRPLFFEGTRYFILRAAKQQNLNLDYEMSGSIFTTLTIENLKAKPTEQGPIQRLEVGTLNIQYSLVDLIRKGLPAFLKLLEVRDVYVELTPGEPLPPDKEEKPQQFKFPALFPDTLNLENVNVFIRAPTGNTEVAGAFFSLLPDRPGALKIQTLDIPGVRRWTNIAAETTFRERNLRLTHLIIGPEIALTEFNLDASKLDENELRVALDGTFFNAPTKISAQISDLNKTNLLNVQARISNFEFKPALEYLNLALPLHGSLADFSLTFQGKPNEPASWSGETTLALNDVSFQQHVLGAVSLSLKLAEARALLSLTENFDPDNILTLEAAADLPTKLEDFPRTTAKGRLTLTAPNLGHLTQGLPEMINGDLVLVSEFGCSDGKLTTLTNIDAKRVATTQAELEEIHFTLKAGKDLTTKADAPIFETLATRLEGRIGKVRFQDYAADELGLVLSSQEGAVAVEQLQLKKAANSLALRADYVLPTDLQSWESQPLRGDLALTAPDLQAFVAPGSELDLKGSLTITGKAEAQNRVLNGDFLINGRDILMHKVPVRSIDGRLVIVNNQASLSQMDVVLNDKNRLRASGSVQLDAPHAYKGSLDVRLTDLSLFQPLLASGTNKPALGGDLTIVWSGTGDAKTPQHVGTANIDLVKGQFDTQKNLTAHVSATYASDYINIPDFHFSAGELGEGRLSLFWKDNRLTISTLEIQQKKLTLLQGYMELPLHLGQLQNVDLLIPSDEPLKLSLTTKDLNLRTLFLQSGQKTAPLLGLLNLNINAEGTLDEVIAKLSLRATGVQSTAAADFAPADISLDLSLQDDRARIDGVVKQKLIQPLTIAGNLPFDVAVIKQKKSIDPQTPVDLRINLPSSSLAFLSSIVPAIRQSRGNAAVDVRVGGTIGAPNLAGSITADLSTLRFTDPSLPPVNAFGLGINFTQDRMVITRCSGGIAGGTFAAGGNITFAQLDNPVFDLRIGARDALVMQNDDLSVRISSNLQVKGPLNAGSVTGNVFVTRSRFFKNIDILPIGLPGRPAPQPPAEPAVVSFPTPPLRNWKFDIAIKTADPFLVQSNLARGTITVDLKLGGTGLEPWMDGSIRIERLTASLPFSRLNIDSGTIYFTRAQPFIPQLDIRGTSTIRDYNVTVFISGPVTEPEAIFNSDPPLLQADIVSLLATGMTSSELTRDPNAIAGRAAVLLFQKLYRSVFQRNQPPSDNESFLSRIQFDIGATDPKTGKQSAAFGIPLSDQIMLSGGLDVGGNFRGQLKYLIRFK